MFYAEQVTKLWLANVTFLLDHTREHEYTLRVQDKNQAIFCRSEVGFYKILWSAIMVGFAYERQNWKLDWLNMHLSEGSDKSFFHLSSIYR